VSKTVVKSSQEVTKQKKSSVSKPTTSSAMKAKSKPGSALAEKKAVSNSGGQSNMQEINGDLPPKLLKMLQSPPKSASQMV
jgi:hypothetical protein